MKIEIVPQAGKKDVLTLLLGGEEWRKIHTSVFGRRLKLPSFSSEAEWKSFFDQLEYSRAKNYVLWRLSVQAYHSQQLHKLLRERLVRPQTIEKVLSECHSSGYLDDEAWLKSFVSLQLKKNGLRAVLAKLQAKGLSADVLQEVRERWGQESGEEEAILHLLETRYRKRDLKLFREKQKVVAALMRKGFSFEAIQLSLKKF